MVQFSDEPAAPSFHFLLSLNVIGPGRGSSIAKKFVLVLLPVVSTEALLVRNQCRLRVDICEHINPLLDDSVDTRSAETRVAARHKCDTVSLPEQQLLPVSLLTWKSSQSLQQVMPWLVAGRLRHFRRW